MSAENFDSKATSKLEIEMQINNLKSFIRLHQADLVGADEAQAKKIEEELAKCGAFLEKFERDLLDFNIASDAKGEELK